MHNINTYSANLGNTILPYGIISSREYHNEYYSQYRKNVESVDYIANIVHDSIIKYHNANLLHHSTSQSNLISSSPTASDSDTLESTSNPIEENISTDSSHVNSQDELENISLHYDASVADMDNITKIVEHEKNILIQNNKGSTALVFRIQSKQMHAAECLVQNNPDIIDIPDSYGKYPIHHALYSNNNDMIKMLIKHGANVDVQDNNGRTPLHYSIDHQNNNATNILVNNGANPNIRDHYLNTPLHYAPLYSNLNTMDTLIKFGADCNIEGAHGKTPLHYAASLKNIPVIKMFISHGADCNIQDEKGKTPLNYLYDIKLHNLISFMCNNQSIITPKTDNSDDASKDSTASGSNSMYKFLYSSILGITSLITAGVGYFYYTKHKSHSEPYAHDELHNAIQEPVTTTVMDHPATQCVQTLCNDTVAWIPCNTSSIKLCVKAGGVYRPVSQFLVDVYNGSNAVENNKNQDTLVDSDEINQYEEIGAVRDNTAINYTIISAVDENEASRVSVDNNYINMYPNVKVAPPLTIEQDSALYDAPNSLIPVTAIYIPTDNQYCNDTDSSCVVLGDIS